MGAAALAALAAVLAGCTSATNGLPNAGSTTTTTTGGTSGPPLLNNNSTITFAPRPRDLPLTGVDPCSLLTSPQQAQLQVRPGVHAHPDDIVFRGSPICSFPFGVRGPGLAYAIEPVTSQGIKYWLDPTLADTLKQVTIAGYPALDLTAKFNPSTDNQCETAVDVANGQLLLVDYAPPAGRPNSEACTQTENVAAAAVATLRTLK